MTAIASPPPAFRAWLCLLLLVGVYSFSWMDRSLIVILIDPIARDLHISNTGIGLLTGFGSSLLYALAGFPIARLADKGSRRNIISLALLIWSGLTAMTGLVGGFVSLALARFGIAIASAGCSPAAYSMISDYFPEKRRGTAIAIYSMGISLGIWAGLSLGGHVEDRLGWRAAFWIIGLPGVLMSLLFFFIVREPARGAFDQGTVHKDSYSLGEAIRLLASNRAFVAIAVGFALISCATSAFENWVPTWLIRVRHMTSSDVGTMSGLYQGLTGIFGTLIFGFLSDKLAERDRRWYVWTALISFCILSPGILVFFTGDARWLNPCYFVIELMASAYSAPLFAAGQMLLPPRLRALGMATILFVLNVIGQGLGPSLTGIISDTFAGFSGQDNLSSAIIVMQVTGVLGVVALIYAAHQLRPRKDILPAAAPVETL